MHNRNVLGYEFPIRFKLIIPSFLQFQGNNLSVENNNLKYLRQRSSKSLLTKAYDGLSATDQSHDLQYGFVSTLYID